MAVHNPSLTVSFDAIFTTSTSTNASVEVRAPETLYAAGATDTADLETLTPAAAAAAEVAADVWAWVWVELLDRLRDGAVLNIWYNITPPDGACATPLTSPWAG